MDDSFKNLNGPSADSIQADYIEKEKKAAAELLDIQLKNARTLSQARSALLKKLSDEARDLGQTTEDYLAQYGLSKRLDALSTELKERRRGYEAHIAELTAAYDLVNQKLIDADKKLAEIRKQNLSQVANYQSEQQKKLASLEQRSIEEARVLREKAARDVAESEASALSDIEVSPVDLTISPELTADEVAIDAQLITQPVESLETELAVSEVSIPNVELADTDLTISEVVVPPVEPLETELSVTDVDLPGIPSLETELVVPEVTVPEIGAIEPELILPEAVQPKAEPIEVELNIPDINLPEPEPLDVEVAVPEVTLPEVSPLEVEITSQDFMVPSVAPVDIEFNIPELTTPEINPVEVNLDVSEPTIPQINPIEVELRASDLTIPPITDVEAELTVSDINLPSIEPVDVSVNTPEIVVPPVEPLETELAIPEINIPSVEPVEVETNINFDLTENLRAAETEALKARLEGLETIKLIEQNIIDLRTGAEENIINSRIALLADQLNNLDSARASNIPNAAPTLSTSQGSNEIVSEQASAASEELKSLNDKLSSQQENLKTAQEMFVVQQQLLSLARTEEETAKQRGLGETQLAELAAKRERLEQDFADAAQGVAEAVQQELETRQKITAAKLAANGISDPTKANVEAAVADRLQALKNFYEEQKDIISKSADLTEADKETKLAELHAKEIADYATLAKAKMAFEQDVADFKLDLDQKAAQERFAQILALQAQEQTSEADLQKQRLANLREASRARPRSAHKGGGGEEAYDFEADPTKPTKEELASQKKEDLSVALGSFEAAMLKQAEALEKANAEKDQKGTENMFKGLWNMGHSLEEIKDVYANYGHLESSDTEGIEAVAKQQILAGLDQEQEVDLAAQAQELQDIMMAAALAGKELSDEEIESKRQAIAEAHAATQEDIAKRRGEADFEAKKKREEVQKTLKDGEKSRKAQEKLDKKKQREDSKFGKSALGKALSTAGTLANPFGDLKAHMEAGDMSPEEATKEAQAKLDAAFDAVNGWINQLASQGKESAKKQASIDTNLQGSKDNGTVLGSYWRKLDAKITMGVGVSPFVLQEDVAKSVETLAGQGISFHIQQRALMDTLKDKIATTFNAADGTMLKLIRIQQADTTAARLGMESALTSFLNSMYETSEFMHTTAASIRDNLYEATALMGAKEATEYEFQVQKWLGSMYSVGFSATEKVSEALGKLTAGDIGGITEGGMGNLLVMAANEASLPIADILEKGLTADQTDRLMESMVNYLSQIYEETKGSNVLAQQYGNVFGVTAADLKAIANLGDETIKNISKHDASYSQMLGQLHQMANTMVLRTSTADMFENIKTNFSYSMATTLANNPVLSGINMMANMLNDLVGGIEIPFVNVYGFGFDLNATVADLMNVAALSGAVLGGMGKMVASLGSGGGFSGSGMLKAFGVEDGSKLSTVTRGNGGTNLTTQGGASQSESGSMAGNESGDDIKNKTLQDASEEPDKQVAEAKEEKEDKDETRHIAVLNHILSIYDLLEEVTNGVRKWHVQLEVGNNPASWSTGTWA